MFKKAALAEILTLSVFLVGIFAFGILIPILGVNVRNLLTAKPTPKPPKISFIKATPAPINENNPKKGVYNALLLGYGGAGHEGSLLTDSIVIAHVDTNTKKAALISIPRDLWVTGNQKVNAVGVTGFQNIGPVLQNVTGLPINYYMAIDFGGFTKIVDNLGGITVNVPKTFDDPFYPITGEENNTCGFTLDQINEFKAKYQGFELEKQFACRYEHLHFEQGQITLNGPNALKFVRSRHGDSDFGRSERQFAVLEGIGNKLINLKSMNKINDTVDTLFKIVKTDLDLGTIKSLGEVFVSPNLYKISHIQITSDNALSQGTSSDGQFILIPKSGGFDFSSVKNYINSNL